MTLDGSNHSCENSNNRDDGASKRKKKMKIRMACEWNNLGHFAIDHFIISDGSLKEKSSSQVDNEKRVESIHRHYLTTYFKAATYAKGFGKKGYASNLNDSGQVLPFAEISAVMRNVLQEWNQRLICPYSDQLEWVRIPSKDLKENDPYVAYRLIWRGAVKRTRFQKRFRRDWTKKKDEKFFSYVPHNFRRLYSIDDVPLAWDSCPSQPYDKTHSPKWLSIVSQRGTTEEIAREVMMDFFFEFIISLNDDDLNRVYKMTFRLDEESGKESDFGVEISVKGHVDQVFESWEKHRVLRYAEKFGWERSLTILQAHYLTYSDEIAFKNLLNKNYGKDIAGQIRPRIMRTLFLWSLGIRFREEDPQHRLVRDTKDVIPDDIPKNLKKRGAANKQKEAKTEFMDEFNNILKTLASERRESQTT